ncbi:MAG: nitrate- and nitrite sensing domain-containing protein [Marinagarivorans sp.]|nr:nitrate- and nitrite sensing domain-containing protein [Marinagarivorans sp.]
MESISIFIVLGLALAGLAGVSALSWCVRRQHQKQKRIQGVMWVQALRSMLMHIQRHRGLSATVLGGEYALMAELTSAQHAVSRDLAHIALVGEWIKDNPNWEAITAHWARLAGQFHRLDIRKNLDQHNRLIKSILVFIDDVSREHYLLTLNDNASWRYLLSVAEDLGQIRAVGLAYISSVEVGEASHRLRNMLQALMAEFSLEVERVDFQQYLSVSNRQATQAFVEKYPKVLLAHADQCPLAQYYQAATDVMDGLYVQFDDELMLIQRTLN